MAYDNVTGEHFSSQMSLPSSSAGSRRRMLYTNPKDARRNIMRLPGAPSSSPEDTPTRSQQAVESGRPFLAFQPSTADLSHQAAQQSWVQPSPTERPPSVERTSSSSGTSTRSNPFDLHVSDHGNNLEDIEAANAGGPYVYDDNEHEIQGEQEGDIAMIEDDASTEAYVADSPHNTPFRLMSALTSCFIAQDRVRAGKKHNNQQNLRRI